MSLGTDLAHLLDVVEKDVPVAIELKDAVVAVLNDFGLFNAAAPADHAEVCSKIQACCEKHLNVAAAAPGGIFPGDGSVLKMLLQIVLTILPLILTPPTA